MKTAHAERKLKAAARETLKRIRFDRDRAPERLRPIVGFIHDHLFDPDLDVTQIKKRVGVRDNSMGIAFHSAVGQPPYQYILARRFETACTLLTGTSFEIWKIAELLGFSSLQVFSRAFKRWCGESPVEYRRRHDPDAPPGAETFARKLAKATGLSEPALLRQALAGQLETERAGDLIGRLHELYPGAAPGASHAGNGAGGGSKPPNDPRGEAGTDGVSAATADETPSSAVESRPTPIGRLGQRSKRSHRA